MQRLLSRALALLLAALAGHVALAGHIALPAAAQTLTPPPAALAGHPGYVTGRFYTPQPGVQTSTIAVATVDTVIYLTPFAAADYPLIATSLNIRTVTGAAGSAVKMAVWANSPTTRRPTGLPIIGSNTGQSTVSSSSTQTIAVTKTFEPGVTYWFGTAFTTLAPTPLSISSSDMRGTSLMGRSVVANTITTSLSTPYAYAGDIMALDLTAATFTDINTSGTPYLWIGN